MSLMHLSDVRQSVSLCLVFFLTLMRAVEVCRAYTRERAARGQRLRYDPGMRVDTNLLIMILT